MNVLAIDQGTSSTKALVVDSAGDILAEAQVPVRPRVLAPDAVEQNPEELFTSVVEAGRAALERAGVAVAAIGLANQGETVLAWDRQSGRALSPAISWQDRRAAVICERLAPHGERLRSLTGLPLDPYFAAPKMTWLRERVTRDGVCTTTDAWLLHRLTGTFVTDATTASRTLLLDLQRGDWSAEACACFGIDPGVLTDIVSCAEIVGETTAFGGRLPIAGLAVDQQAALFGQACFRPGDAKCTYGTGAFLLANTGARVVRSSSGLVSCVAWRISGAPTYCLDGQAYTVGAALNWLQAIGLLHDPAEIDVLGAEAPDSHGVVFVPALAGLAAPFWRPAARGAFVGLSLATERAHLIRAVIDGIAAQVAWLARAAAEDVGRPLSVLRADGGLTRSRALMQAQADLAQIPIEVSASPHATALGVAAFARLGVGAARTPAEAVGAARRAATYAPQITADQAAVRLQRWRQVVNATMDLPRDDD